MHHWQAQCKRDHCVFEQNKNLGKYLQQESKNFWFNTDLLLIQPGLSCRVIGNRITKSQDQ